MMAFAEFFRAATGNEPHPYQRRLAEAEPLPHLLSIPADAEWTEPLPLLRRGALFRDPYVAARMGGVPSSWPRSL